MKTRHRVLQMVFLIIFGVVTFLVYYEPYGAIKIPKNPAIQAGFQMAQNCLPSNHKISDVKFYKVPVKQLTILFFFGQKIGYTNLAQQKIFVVESEQNNSITWAHEFIHTFGIMGHPKSIFDRCNL
jgi:hypothetical protein